MNRFTRVCNMAARMMFERLNNNEKTEDDWLVIDAMILINTGHVTI